MTPDSRTLIPHARNATDMRKGVALLATAAVLATVLSGCSSGSKGGFSVKAPAAPGGEYTFTASGKADNYTWDLGDRLTVLYGKSVHHAYDFKNGKLTVKLTEKTGGKSAESSQELTLGTGQNAPATFFLDGSTNWTIPGEQMTFTAKASTDPDGDPLRYSWSCVRTQDAVRLPTHTHPGFGGVPFATPPAGTVTARTLVGAAPKADRTVPGDLCDALGSGGRPTKDATITGSFSKTGIYDIYLLASDPVHPSTSGKFHMAVTAPGERPARVQTPTFSDVFTAGTVGENGTMQSACISAPQVCGNTTYDGATHVFSLPLTGKGGYVASAFDGTPALGNANRGGAEWEIFRGTIRIAGGAIGDNVTLNPADTTATGYTVHVYSHEPSGVKTTLKVVIPLDMDPFKVY